MNKMKNVIARGAEAVIVKDKKSIIKKRLKKSYRHTVIDEKLRRFRTRHEAKIIEKLSKIIPIAQIQEVDEEKKEIRLEFIPGKKLSTSLDNLKNINSVAKQIGQSIAKMHDYGVIHGDLTTSNMILNKVVHIIDFGLGFHSLRIEDKAVDLHVFKEALEAKHPSCATLVWSAFVKGYQSSIHSSAVLKQLGKVEMRGRYKSHY